LRSAQRLLLVLVQRFIAVSRRVLPSFVKRRIAHLSAPVIAAIATPIGVDFVQRPVALSDWPPILPEEFFASGPIVLVNDALGAGGTERQIVNTLRGLAERHLPSGLLCLRLHEAPEMDFFLPMLADFPGFIRNAAPLREAEKQLASIAPPEASRQIRQAIGWLPLDIQADIIRLTGELATVKPSAVHGWQDATSIAAAYAARMIGVPRILVSSRNVAPTNFRYFRPYMLDAYREIAACPSIVMINNSEAGARDYARWLGVPVDRMIVGRNGIDTRAVQRVALQVVADLRAKLGIPAHVRVVGSIFRFLAEKQPLLWIETAALILAQHPDCYFVIFGDGPILDQAKALAKARGVGDRLVCPGITADTAASLSLLDVFLLTSKFEGTPNVLLEASSMGIPVVATDAGGTREVVAEEVTGFVVPDADPASLAEKVISILDDDTWTERVRVAGPAFVRERFGLDRMLAETIALYRAGRA